MLTYIDTDKIGRLFKHFNLNTDNILDFITTEDNDNIKHLLKLYLLSTLEDYKHIKKLTENVYYDQSFEITPTSEVINKKAIKPFWELVKSRQNIKKESHYKELWIELHLEKYLHFLENEKNKKIEESVLINRINNEQNPIKKLKLKYKLLKLDLESKKQRKEIESSYKKYFGNTSGLDDFPKLIEAAKEFILKKEEESQRELCQLKKVEIKELLELYKSKKITIKEYKKRLEELNNSLNEDIESRLSWFKPSLHTNRIIEFVKNYFDERNIIDFLKEDLVFNYYMITKIFDSEFLQENDLEKILYNIRKLMMDYNINRKNHTRDAHREYDGLKYGANPLSTDYRETSLRKDSNFFKNTAEPKDIMSKMHELISKYNTIKDIKDDTQYALECYKLSQEFLQIHPYSNGNGRTSKYLFYYFLLKRNILPFTITDNNALTNCYQNISTKPENYFEYRNNIMARRSKL